MEWTQIRVNINQVDLDRVVAIMSMVDPGLLIEDYSDIEENMTQVYGNLVDESILKPLSARNEECKRCYCIS